MVMIIDLTDYETKKLELDIKALEKAILETKGIIANLQYNKLHHELTLIKQGITKADVEKHIVDFFNSSDNPEEDIIKIHKEMEKELEEYKETGNDVIIEDLDKILHYSTIAITIINLQIQDYQEEIKVLRKQLNELNIKQLELQENKINDLETNIKYRELLNDE